MAEQKGWGHRGGGVGLLCLGLGSAPAPLGWGRLGTSWGVAREQGRSGRLLGTGTGAQLAAICRLPVGGGGDTGKPEFTRRKYLLIWEGA